MADIHLTHAQLRVIMSRAQTTPGVTKRKAQALILDGLCPLRQHGSGWVVDMDDEHVETALAVFEAYLEDHPSASATTCLRYFVGASKIAQQILADRKAQTDVPRETSDDQP
jgi:hypothetical protein